MIPENFKKINIDTLKIESAYSKSSKPYNINLNDDKNNIINIHTLNKIREISKLDKIKTYNEYFNTFSRNLNINISDIVRWDLILGKSKSKEYSKYLKDIILSSLNLVTSYHFNLFVKRCNTYLNLNSVIMNNKPMVIPKYSHKSITGRTTITSGTNFLTMAKSDRRLLKSKNSDNILVEVDFKSCEPNFYLRVMGKKIDYDDVYFNRQGGLKETEYVFL